MGLNPAQDSAWDNLARLECRTNRCPQIENEIRGAINQQPAAIGPRNALVFVLMQQKKLEPAATEAKKVLKADERNVRAMQLLAQVYFKESKAELARLVLENARAIDVNDSATHNAMGLVLLQLKQRPQALESFKTAAALKPDNAEARNNFGAMLNDAQDYDAAVQELEAAVAAAPEFTLAHLNLGNAYRGQQQLPKAIAEYQRVLKARPDYTDVYFNLGVTHLDSEIAGLDPVERFKSAIAYFNQYKEKGGKDERVDQYVKDATKGIDKEERRREREKKDQLKKVDQAKKAETDAKQKLIDDAKQAEGDAAKKKADEAAPGQKAQQALDKAEADAKKKAEADAKKKPPKKGLAKPAAKLGDDDTGAPEPTPAKKPGTGKLGGDEK